MKKPKASKTDVLRSTDEVEEERCSGPCNKVLPLNEGYFHRDATSATGFMSICKECRSQQRRVEEARSIVEKVEKIEQHGIDMMNEQVESSGDSGCAHVATTFEDTLELFGGSQGFARHVYGQYLQCKPGSAGRTRILTTLLATQMKLTEAGHADKPTEKMTDEELREELRNALKIHQPPTGSD